MNRFMKFRSIFFFFLLLVFLVVACGPSRQTASPSGGGEAPSGGENPPAQGNAPSSQGNRAAPGDRVVTYIEVEGIGRVAVRVTFPDAPRYPDGAGVVVDIATFFTKTNDFYEDLDAAPIGLIRVSYLWPGKESPSTGARSDGEFDYGGETSIRALSEVIRFAGGQIPDVNGHFIGDISPFPVLTENLGLYAFSHPGIAAVNVLALYGDTLNVRYFVGRENPTVDAISAVELGYWDEDENPVVNPFYHFPEDYSPTKISLDYSSVRWDAEKVYRQSPEYRGYPYFDVNQNGRDDEGDFVLSYKVPTMFGKRFFSAALTQALRENGALTEENWPSDVATPEEAAQVWDFRVTPPRYPSLAEKTPDLKVLLLFCKHGHVQPLPDRPQVHQAYDGFRAAGLWTRLNPDAAYMLPAKKFPGYQDHPANTEPQTWASFDDWAYEPLPGAAALAAQAAVAEMADRTHEGNWDADIASPLVSFDASPSVGTSSETAAPPVSSASGSEPLSVVYVLHVQVVGNDLAPYTDASLQTVDPKQVQGILETITAISKVAERHGVPITWEFPQILAQGVCSEARQPNIFETLSAAGHEIAAYAHADSIVSAYRTLESCGFAPVTLGGLLIDASKSASPQKTFSEELALAAQTGYRYVTVDLAPSEDARRNPFGALCHNEIGAGNDMWEETHNLLFPWFPDYAHQNICTPLPSGDILFIDHSHSTWMSGANGQMASLLTDKNFETLGNWLEGALTYVEEHPNAGPASWGFVSHLTEFTKVDDGTGKPSRDALDALDRFLSRLEDLESEGKIRLVPAREIGAQFLP